MKFYVGTDLEYYGPEATEKDVEAYIKFARQHLGEDTEIERVSVYQNGGHEAEEKYHLRQQVWDAFCAS